MFVSTHSIQFVVFGGSTSKNDKLNRQICSASTQVTTTTLQKNLTAEIKWYI